jgi:hypothetical protein
MCVETVLSRKYSQSGAVRPTDEEVRLAITNADGGQILRDCKNESTAHGWRSVRPGWWPWLSPIPVHLVRGLQPDAVEVADVADSVGAAGLSCMAAARKKKPGTFRTVERAMGIEPTS